MISVRGHETMDRDLVCHISVMRALAEADITLSELMHHRKTIRSAGILPAVEHMLDPDGPEPDIRGWALFNAADRFLGAGFAWSPVPDYQLLGTCGQATIRCCADGLVLHEQGTPARRIHGLEQTNHGPQVIAADWSLQPPDSQDGSRLLKTLMGGSRRVTEVETSFSFLCYRPLMRLRTLLLHHEEVLSKVEDVSSPL